MKLPFTYLAETTKFLRHALLFPKYVGLYTSNWNLKVGRIGCSRTTNERFWYREFLSLPIFSSQNRDRFPILAGKDGQRQLNRLMKIIYRIISVLETVKKVSQFCLYDIILKQQFWKGGTESLLMAWLFYSKRSFSHKLACFFANPDQLLDVI